MSIMFGTLIGSGTSSKYKKRERTQNWCIDEKKYLLELCRKDMYIIENKRLDSALTSLKNRAWKIIHKKFCHTFGTDRNCNRIKEQWRRMKACARAEILDYQHRITKFGKELADKKKPSQFTFEIWDFMQDAKKLCKNELTDEVDYTKIKLTLEENLSADELMLDDEDNVDTNSSQSSSNWVPSTQNMCEVQLKDDSESHSPKYVKNPSDYFQSSINNESNPINNIDVNQDFLNFIKNQYIAAAQVQNNENNVRNFNTKSQTKNRNEVYKDDFKFKEHELKMEILKTELETAKINKEIAQMIKDILSEHFCKG